MRGRLAVASPDPAVFRAAITAVPPRERDAWLDAALGIDGVADDGPDLPSGCVPYLPCAVETLLRMIDVAAITADDVFVDVGAGVGRAAALVHLVTGAPAVGVEVQPHLARAARDLAGRIPSARLAVIEGDAARSIDHVPACDGAVRGPEARARFPWSVGTVFFFYCPFGGERLRRVLGDLEAVAAARPLRVCCVDLPLPPCPWLTTITEPGDALTILRSQRRDGPA
jgi:hypothetical protein